MDTSRLHGLAKLCRRTRVINTHMRTAKHHLQGDPLFGVHAMGNIQGCVTIGMVIFVYSAKCGCANIGMVLVVVYSKCRFETMGMELFVRESVFETEYE